ncbi:hypothetical protein [Luteimonas notoginsengisoli]|uniref:Glycosyltransferase RgtA/B/C/D-like domain-containing protein n=1 Tax=Luteimonas notoginsengisoli TaxID=1578200 RepID=A0ABV7UPX3_9GAMM
MAPPPDDARRHLVPLARALALFYLLAGVAAMWWLAPRVPYADGWRLLGHFLQAPFPQDILAPDNGHHEVLPNAVRVIELHAFAAQQWLQVVVGIALALTTVLVFWRGIRGLAAAPARSAALLAVVLGVFWLGNIRALAHGNESVHAYCVTLFLAIGLHVLSRERGGRDGVVDAALAAACGLAAAFSFGSGIACFAGFAAVLALRRAPWPQWIALAAGLLLALVLLHFDGGSGALPALAPLRQGETLLRWLAGPFVYAAWPLLDTQLAAQVPVTAARVPAQAIAHAYEGAFGPVLLARWPHLLFGLAGLAWLAVLAWRAWRDRASAAMAGIGLAGIGLACFAAAVGAMIALVRIDYFSVHPGQLLAPRYVVWSSLFWAGLLLATAAQARRPARALALVVLVAITLLPSQLWMAKLGGGMQAVAGQTGLAAAVGVVEPSLPLGETVPEELAAALPSARAARVAVFAWPETQWLGHRPEADAMHPLDARDVEVAVVDNRLDPGARGRRVRFVLDDAPGERVLLLDGDGMVRGLAMRDRERGCWIGWMRGPGVADGIAPRVAATAGR